MASTPDILSKLNVGSGMNNSEIITALVDAERVPKQERIEKDKLETENTISAYGVIKNDISSFRDIVRSIQSSDASGFIGSSSNTTVANFTTTGNTGTAAINSSLTIDTLANTHTLVSGTYSNTGATVGSGSLTIDFGTWSTTSSSNDTFTANSNSSVTINTSSTTSLIQLRDAINNATDNAEATVMNNGSGYIIVLKGLSGAENELRITPGAGSSSALSDNFAYTTSAKELTQTVDGVDASFTVDGISMTRSSNTISDLYNGYTLELESTTSSAIKISSSQDITTIESLLSDFVNSYNSVYSGISSLTTVPLSSDSSAGPLSGDSLARTIQRELRSFTTKSVEGYEDGPYSLSLLGVSTNRDGSISLNPNTLKNSFEANPTIVDAIFKDQLFSDNAEVEVTAVGKDSNPGSYALTKSGSDYLLDGVTLTANGTSYSSSSGDTNGIVLKIPSSDISSANIYYGQSLMSLVDTSLTNFLSFNGDINNRLNNLNDRLSDFSDQQEALDERMNTLTDRFTVQFLAMEQSIAGLKETGNYLDQMLQQDSD